MPGRQDVRRKAYRLGLESFRRMPRPLRRLVVRAVTPNFTVGAVCALVRNGEVLLLRQRHRYGWTLPGGLLNRGEDCDAAVRRELREELRVDLDPGLPVTTLVDPQAQRVDVIYRLEAEFGLAPRPRGEALEAQWIRPEDLTAADGETVQILARLMAARGGEI